jgi:hypothetical protein
VHLTEFYFNHCHDLFVQARLNDAHDDDFYFRVAGRYTVRVMFGREGISLPFRKALTQLETDVAEADLSICVWDSMKSASFTPPCPSWDNDGKFGGQTVVKGGGVRIACELLPNRLSVVDNRRNVGLFWIDDVDNFPWFEQCRPLRNILHWWLAEKRMYTVHAACVGFQHGCILVIGDAGSGKSTTALSTLDSDLQFCSDDLCLIGLNDNKAWSYNLYNAGKLEHFERLPNLQSYVWNPSRAPEEKAVIFVQEGFPQKLLLDAPISAIVWPCITDEPLSRLEPSNTGEVLRTLAKSTVIETFGGSPEDFLGIIKTCGKVPCYILRAGKDRAHVNQVLADLLRRSELLPA